MDESHAHLALHNHHRRRHGPYSGLHPLISWGSAAAPRESAEESRVAANIEEEQLPCPVPCSEETLVNSTLLVWSQLHGIVTLRISGSIQAAVAYQDWPAACALTHDDEVAQLIKNHRDNLVNGILNSQRSESHH